MGTKEAKRDDASLILNTRNQSIVVTLDVENDTPALENARFWVRRFNILRVAPLCAINDIEPRLKL